MGIVQMKITILTCEDNDIYINICNVFGTFGYMLLTFSVIYGLYDC